MTDRDGHKVSVFALNYGLCQQYTITFGRPLGEREFRLYFVERVFDYTPIMQAFVEKNQEILCNKCGERQSFDKLEALQLYGMQCPVCKPGRCVVVNLSRKYAPLLQGVQEELLLPEQSWAYFKRSIARINRGGRRLLRKSLIVHISLLASVPSELQGTRPCEANSGRARSSVARSQDWLRIAIFPRPMRNNWIWAKTDEPDTWETVDRKGRSGTTQAHKPNGPSAPIPQPRPHSLTPTKSTTYPQNHPKILDTPL